MLDGRPVDDRSAAALLDSSPDAMLLVDEGGRIALANDRVTDLFGYEPDELLGEPVERLVPDDERAAHVEKRNAYLAEPETRPMAAGLDLHARRKDGTTAPVDIALSTIDVDGHTYVVTVVRDASVREALGAQYRTILEAVPDAVVVADADSGEIVEANDQVAGLLGYDPAELLGRPQTELHPAGEEDRYRALFEEHVESGREIFEEFPDGSPVVVETKAGERVPVEINAHVFELGDRRLIVGVFRDVSTRVERERLLEALHETTRRLMAAGDREEIADIVADATTRILGYSGNVVRFVVEGARMRPAAITERARADLGPRPEYPLDGDNPGARVFSTGRPLLYDDVREIDDGYDRSAVRSAMYLPIGEHGMISVVDPAVAAFDRSDVELAAILAAGAETALDRLEYERELERQNEQLERFASVVSHDLRNPLAVARGWLEQIDAAGPERERVADALDRMAAIVDDTLTLARQGRTVSSREPVDVADLARECWGMVSTSGARLEVADECFLLGDPDRLRHVFENLFRNAVEHGGEDVVVRVGTLDGGDGIYVEDDGPGIPADAREEVFEPGRSTQPSGTGFGLTIVEQVAEAHGWTVRVADGERGGARFEFTGVEFA